MTAPGKTLNRSTQFYHYGARSMILHKATDNGRLLITDSRVKNMLGVRKNIVVVDVSLEEAKGIVAATPEEVAKGIEIIGEKEKSVIAIEKPVIETMLVVVKKCVDGVMVKEKRVYEVRRLVLRGRVYRRLVRVEREVSRDCPSNSQ